MSVNFYMQRPAELAKQPTAWPMFKLISEYAPHEQQAHVLAALWLAWNFEHALDDLLDEKQLAAVNKESVARKLFDLMESILTGQPPCNFFIARYQELIESSEWEPERKRLAERAAQDFIGDLLVNPFIRQHAGQFLAMYHMMIARMLDGDEMASAEDGARRRLAPAVRCGDVDFIVHVAKLAGGWDAMRAIGRQRDYDPAD